MYIKAIYEREEIVPYLSNVSFLQNSRVREVYLLLQHDQSKILSLLFGQRSDQ
jgi:hypothetical protein